MYTNLPAYAFNVIRLKVLALIFYEYSVYLVFPNNIPFDVEYGVIAPFQNIYAIASNVVHFVAHPIADSGHIIEKYGELTIESVVNGTKQIVTNEFTAWSNHPFRAIATLGVIYAASALSNAILRPIKVKPTRPPKLPRNLPLPVGDSNLLSGLHNVNPNVSIKISKTAKLSKIPKVAKISCGSNASGLYGANLNPSVIATATIANSHLPNTFELDAVKLQPFHLSIIRTSCSNSRMLALE